MELWILLAATVAALIIVAVWWFTRKKTEPTGLEAEPERVQPPTTDTVVVVAPPKKGPRLQKLAKFLGLQTSEVTSAEWDGLEEALLEGDVGTATTGIVLERLKSRTASAEGGALKPIMAEECERLFAGLEHGEKSVGDVKPLVISIVGVNGVGKTTTIGKLAKSFSGKGKKVLLGAADTFRAAAIGQLKVWADRTGADFVTGREGADPGAVAFDALTAGKARGVDVVLIDTAGRLHTKTNLMEELKKIHRVMKKVIPEAPHETWLVVDGTLGQNSVQQAREFTKALELTGVIVTKLDGTARGGAVMAIAAELKLPIRYVGLGEQAEDLVPFAPKAFVESILGD